MWKCPKCNRVFNKANQPHSCESVPLESHFIKKELAKALFKEVLAAIKKEIGDFEVISLPCCVHLFGKYDFIALLPHRNSLELRFALDRSLESNRLKISVKVSEKAYKNCVDIKSNSEIDSELIGWLKEAYFLKDI